MLDRLLGAWLLLDSVISIAYYLRRRDETWVQNHSVRVVRGLIGLFYLWRGWRGNRKGGEGDEGDDSVSVA